MFFQLQPYIYWNLGYRLTEIVSYRSGFFYLLWEGQVSVFKTISVFFFFFYLFGWINARWLFGCCIYICLLLMSFMVAVYYGLFFCFCFFYPVDTHCIYCKHKEHIQYLHSNFSTRIVFSFVKLFSCTEHIVIAKIEMNVR